jgi:SAM-dependent methyltransferase
LREDLEKYDHHTKQYFGKPLKDCRVLEIGYGARPYRLMALTSIGAEACGIDLDAPMLHGHPRELLRILRMNGMERALKSAVRFYCFDLPERRALKRFLASVGGCLRIEQDRFLVGDAAREQTWKSVPPKSLDLVLSEDVLEHIATKDLPALIQLVASHLKPDGIALLCPFIYTGISGNHLPEWYPHLVNSDINRHSEPWEHLRKNRFQANTYLNRLTRSEFRALFSEHFEILNESAILGDLGRRFLDPTFRQELSAYDEDELFSNAVVFVLRPTIRHRHLQP